MFSGTPYPIAAAPSESRSSTTPSIAPNTSAWSPSGVAISIVRPIVPSRATSPGEDLRPAEVDPDNTLFTHVAATITARMPEQEKPYRVYKGGRAKGKVPLQRPSGRPEQGFRPRRAIVGSPRRRHVGRWITLSLLIVLRSRRRLARRELPLRLRWHQGRERPRPGARGRRAEEPGRPPLVHSDDDPRARNRRWHAARPQRCPSLRLGDADPHRPEQAPARLPLDSPRPEGRDPGARCGEAQRRLAARRAGADAQDGQGPDGPRRQPHRGRQLRPVPRADRLGRRHRRRRPEADPLEPLRLPVRDARRGAGSGRAGASRRAPST